VLLSKVTTAGKTDTNKFNNINNNKNNNVVRMMEIVNWRRVLLNKDAWIKEQAEKILKYKHLTTEMWNVKTKVISVIIGATGTMSISQNT
jgi:hypothetical protein